MALRATLDCNLPRQDHRHLSEGRSRATQACCASADRWLHLPGWSTVHDVSAPELPPFPTARHVARQQRLSAKERASTQETAESIGPSELDILAELRPTLITSVHGYVDRATAIQDFVGDAVARRDAALPADFFNTVFPFPLPRQNKSKKVGFNWPMLTIGLAMYITPILAWLWFDSHYRWWGYVLVGMGVGYAGILAAGILWLMTPGSPPRGLVLARRLLVLLTLFAALTVVVVWRGEHLGMWEMIVIGTGLCFVALEIGFTLQRRRGVYGQLDQLQTLALDLVDLLNTVHPAVLDGAKPPVVLVNKLEASAKRVLAASDRATLRWKSNEHQVRSWIRESGGSIAAGLRWHKRLVVLPTADACTELFASLGRGLAAAAVGDWQALMFEPAPSAARSFWQRWRGRLTVAVVLGAITGATYAFPNLLPSSAETQLRGLLVLTAAFSLLAAPTDTFGRAYSAVGNLFSASGITPGGKADIRNWFRI
jgi:hypothetical protein